MKPPRTREGAELLATMLGENVQAPPKRRGLSLGIGAAEITFAVGAALFLAGIALVSVAAALVAAGVMLGLLAWNVT